MNQNLRRLLQQAAEQQKGSAAVQAMVEGAEKIPYAITLQIDDLASGSEDSDSEQLDASEIFIAESITYAVAGATLASITDAAKLYPLVIVQLRDTASGKGVFSQRTPLASVAGDARQPYVLPVPLVFLSKPYLEAENISTDVAYKRVFVTLHGYKVRG